MNITGALLILAGLILLALLPRLRPSKPPLRLGLASKSRSDRESPHSETHRPNGRHQAA